MITELIDIGPNKFLKIPVMPICQKNKYFYLAKLPAKYLIDTYTVYVVSRGETIRGSN
jgi:hypothetical protein